MRRPQSTMVSVSIDTEEDDWGSYAVSGATVRNISRLPGLQALFEKWGVRPTYLVNSAVVDEPESWPVMRTLAERDDVEIGAHCHPWNTPPLRGGGVGDSMMCGAPDNLNRARIAYTTERIRDALGVLPTCFRAGRWGFGPSVARPLAELGFRVDASVSPTIDWSHMAGPDFSVAPRDPYRFHPSSPLVPDPSGSMIELPTTIGFLRGRQDRAHRVRRRLEGSRLGRLKVVGLLDVTGFLSKRWLSPETTSARDMTRLAETLSAQGQRHLGLTFHSSTLLPGATPFVRDERELGRFLGRLEAFFEYCAQVGFEFKTLSDVAETILGDDSRPHTVDPVAGP